MEQKCKSCGTTKAAAEFYRDARKKNGLVGECRDCWNSRRKRRYALADKSALSGKRKAEYFRNRDRICAQVKASNLRNREAYLERNRRYAAQNAERKRLAAAAWRAADPIRAKQSARNARIRNSARVYSANKRRAAQQIRAVPGWADMDAIRRFYADAKAFADATGKPWHVDHIVPLRSDVVCGLHCEANLQVISGAENLKKTNKWWPDMPDILHSDYPQPHKKLIRNDPQNSSFHI
jgi:hypothetical protein